MIKMLGVYAKGIVLAGLIYVTSATGARAQDVVPFGPLPVDEWHNVRLFEPVELGVFGGHPPVSYGWFGSAERVYWSIGKPRYTSIGSEAAEGVYNIDGNRVFLENSGDNGFVKASGAWGNRFDLGYVQENNRGWMVSVLNNVRQAHSKTFNNALVLFDDPNGFFDGVFVDDVNQQGPFGTLSPPTAGADEVFDDLDMDSVFGKSGRDIGTDDGMGNLVFPFDGLPDQFVDWDLDDAQQFLPRFATLIAESETRIYGVELMRVHRMGRLPLGGLFEFYYGARYMQINDQFRLFSDPLNEVDNTNVLDDMAVMNQVQNNMVGPQIGYRYSHQSKRWIFSVEGRFFAALNLQNANLMAEVADEIPQQVDFTGPVPSSNFSINRNGLFAQSSTDSDYTEEYSAVGELRVNTAVRISKAVSVKLGYTFLWMDNIGRASNTIDYTLPNFRLRKPVPEDLFVNGVSVGVELLRP